MSNRALRILLPFLTVLTFVACNGDDDADDDTGAGVEPGVTVVGPTAAPTDEAAPPTTPVASSGSTNPVEAPAPANFPPARLVAVRAATHEGFDRLVFEFSGSQVPGYSVKYGQAAIACGSGQDQTELVGSGKKPAALMLVDVRPVDAHDQAGNVTAPRDVTQGLPIFQRAFRICDFEAVTQYAVALTAEKPFKVSTLSGPPRLVIDIAH